MTTGLVVFASLIILIVAGIPVALSIGIVAVTGMWFVAGENYLLATLKSLPFAVTSSYSFAVVPMFILMGAVASSSGMVGHLYTAGYRWLSQVRGSLFMATTVASAGFAAISGSTIVNAAVFTKIALPEMLKYGYDRAISAGCIAAAGTFAALIPPSISLILYGILTQESIGALLMAGVVPGLFTAGAYLVFLFFGVRLFPKWAPTRREHFSWSSRFSSLSKVWPIILLASFVLGGIYGGYFSASAAGAIGAVGAIIIATAIGGLRLGGLYEALRETVITTSVLFLIIIAGMMLSRLLLFSGFVGEVIGLVQYYDINRYVIILSLIVMYILLGMIIDPISMMVMTIPFVHPLVVALGFDPIWFAIIMIKLVELGTITPPVGINLFAMVGASNGQVSLTDAYRGIVPFIILELIILAFLIAFPAITTALPDAMIRN